MARRRLRTTRTRPRTRRDGGDERPRDDHKGRTSRPSRHDRDQTVAPRVEISLIETTGDARARLTKRVLAAVPGTHADGRGAARLYLVLMIADRAPHLTLHRAVIVLALAGEAVGRGRDGIFLRGHVETFDHEQTVTSEEASHLRDRFRPRIVVEKASEGILGRHDQVVLAFARKLIETIADVEDTSRFKSGGQSLPLFLAARARFKEISPGGQHIAL